MRVDKLQNGHIEADTALLSTSNLQQVKSIWNQKIREVLVIYYLLESDKKQCWTSI